MTTKTRPVYEIAIEIRSNWEPVHPYAVPYVNAMMSLNSIEDNYIMDSGKEIVLRFLANAGTWRGDVARRIKAELKTMAGIK